MDEKLQLEYLKIISALIERTNTDKSLNDEVEALRHDVARLQRTIESIRPFTCMLNRCKERIAFRTIMNKDRR